MIKRFTSIAGLSVLCGACSAQVNFTGSYAENFNGLKAGGGTLDEGIAEIWTDNSSVPGWYSNAQAIADARTLQPARYTIVSGTAGIAGHILSVGATEDLDRALGTVGTNGVAIPAPVIALRLRNNTGGVLESLHFTFAAELWRNPTGRVNVLSGSYRIGGAALEGGDYVAAPNLDVTSRAPAAGDPSRNGNDPANRILFDTVLTGFSLAQNEDIWIRWSDFNDPSGDAMFALDDMLVTGSPVPVPEPASIVMLSLGAVALLRRKGKK
jgi:hypothetical protein